VALSSLGFASGVNGLQNDIFSPNVTPTPLLPQHWLLQAAFFSLVSASTLVVAGSFS
jgi:hypothetical protein